MPVFTFFLFFYIKMKKIPYKLHQYEEASQALHTQKNELHNYINNEYIGGGVSPPIYS